MLEQINSQTITISPEAAKAVVDILAEKELVGYALRIYVSGGGCCGAQFGMALDNNLYIGLSAVENSIRADIHPFFGFRSLNFPHIW